MIPSNDYKYIGCDDLDLDLFEGQYPIPNGVSYNSYLLLDESVVVFDTVDKRKKNEWLKNLNKELNNRNVDYLIVSHLEPDHSSCILDLALKYPNMKLVMTEKAKAMLKNFFTISNEIIVVGENDTIKTGKHTISFIMAPMVHWPEVMMEYDSLDGLLFSADGFGKFGALSANEEWDDEARRYYINIVGKYGNPVKQVLKKASNLDIKAILPLHGPILNSNLGHYLNLYDIWSSYKYEDEGVLIASASIHGNTYDVALKLKDICDTNNIEAHVIDLTRVDLSYPVALAFKYKYMVLLAPTYDGYIFTPMEDFLLRLSHKSYQNRSVGLIENGSWAPMANKLMSEQLLKMKNINILEPKITIKTKMTDSNVLELKKLIANFK